MLLWINLFVFLYLFALKSKFFSPDRIEYLGKYLSFSSIENIGEKYKKILY